MICFICHQPIRVELDILTLFKKISPLCEACRSDLLEETKTDYVRPHEVISFLDYNPAVKELFHRYKFMRDYCLAEVLSLFIKIKAHQYDVIIPIPLSKKRLAERGYNQVTAVLDILKITYTDCLVSKERARQSELTKEARAKSQNPFTFKASFDVSFLHEKRILIVDDIYTTGMTMSYAMEVLEVAGLNDIKVLTFSKV